MSDELIKKKTQETAAKLFGKGIKTESSLSPLEGV